MKIRNVLKSCLILRWLTIILDRKMKSACVLRLALVGILVSVGLALFAASVLAAEYVVNGGFETGLDPWEISGGIITVTSDQAHSGSQSISLTAYTGYARVEQPMLLESGVVYTLSAWSFGDGVHPVEVSLYSSYEELYWAYLPVSQGWSHTEYSFVPATSEIHTLAFYIAGYSGGASGYVDDVSIFDGASAPAPTPVSWTIVTGTLPSGNVYAVEYRTTAGDIFVGVAAFIFLVVAIAARKVL